ncbi:hypothetical protein [Noviherbaspirillum saxi]|uniref:Uncharacterized protein n=1 Tax=Noviherbaspirillum saxi TaxID=2320863 RepID=A0A3A3G216_9BURK|nr:hypothetical protein [Noviherbaspirillum saxi]RJF92113.1 hypothetical protein D3871_26065 [Noviherbaspirillum saxi]
MEEDWTATQSFMEFAELTQDATDRLNALFARSRIVEVTNPALFESLKRAIDTMVKDPRFKYAAY